MRLDSTMRQDEIRAALDDAALKTWGAARRDAIGATLDNAAKAIWLVLQEPIAPRGEEPDLPPQPDRSAREG